MEQMNNKRLAINFLASIVTYGTTALINFLLSPYIVAHAGEAAYGFVSLATSFTTYATIVSTAINSMSGRFVMIATTKDDKQAANQYFVSALGADVILGLVFLLLGTGIVLSLEQLLNVPVELVLDVKVLFSFVFISFVINTVGSAFEIGYFVTNKLYLASIRTIITALLRAVVVAVLFATLTVHIYYLGIGLLVVAIVTIIYNAHQTKKLLPFVAYSIKNFRPSIIKEVAAAGVWNSVNLLGTTFTEGLDLLICNIWLSPTLMGVMSVSKTIPAMLKAIQSTVVGIFAPEIVKKYAQGDSDGMKQYLLESTRIMRLTLCVPFGVFCGLGIAFYQLWMPDLDAMQLFVLSLLSLVPVFFAIGVSPIYNVFTAANKLRIPSLLHVTGGALSVGITLILLKTTTLGVYAVAGVSSVIEIIKTFALILPYEAKLVNEKPTYFWSSALKSAAIVIATALPGLAYVHFVGVWSWLHLIIAGVVYVILAYIFVLATCASDAERKKLMGRLLKQK